MRDKCLETWDKLESLPNNSLRRIVKVNSPSVERRQDAIWLSYGWAFISYALTNLASGTLRLFGAHDAAQSVDSFSNSLYMVGAAVAPGVVSCLLESTGSRKIQSLRCGIARQILEERQAKRDSKLANGELVYSI